MSTDRGIFFKFLHKVGSVSVTGAQAASILSGGDRCARESVRTRPGSEDSNRTTCICDALLVAVKALFSDGEGRALFCANR